MSGAKQRMRGKKMRNQPVSVQYPSSMNVMDSPTNDGDSPKNEGDIPQKAEDTPVPGI